MSRLSPHARWGGRLWFMGHLKRTKDGRYVCLLHPKARIAHPRWSAWRCTECWEPITKKQGRKTFTYWVRRHTPQERTFPMNRTRPARKEQT